MNAIEKILHDGETTEHRLASQFASRKLEEGGVIVEVGVGSSVNALRMRRLLKPKTMYLVDPYFVPDNWPEAEKEYANIECATNLGRTLKIVSMLDNLILINKESHIGCNDVPNSLDFVYIDGIHDAFNVERDIRCWYPKIRIGGILSGHDYYDGGVETAVKKMFPEFVSLGMLEYNPDNNLNAQGSDWWIVKDKEREWILS